MQPGDTINPDNQPASTSQPTPNQAPAPHIPTSPVEPARPAPQATQIDQGGQVDPPADSDPEATQGQAPTQPSQPNWQYSQSASQPSSLAQSSGPQLESVSWTASEFIAHNKSYPWFLLFSVIWAVVVAVVYLLIREWLPTIMMGLIGVAFAMMAARQPRELQYHLSPQGLQIGQDQYSFAEFKSFAVIEDGGVRSILLIPLRRFMPPLSLYYDPQDEENIITLLSDFVPYEQQQLDLVERLMRKIRF